MKIRGFRWGIAGLLLLAFSLNYLQVYFGMVVLPPLALLLIHLFARKPGTTTTPPAMATSL